MAGGNPNLRKTLSQLTTTFARVKKGLCIMSTMHGSTDDRRADAGRGFTYAMDRTTALRQFHLSVCIIAVLGVAIVTAAFSLRGAPAENRGYTTFAFEVIQPAKAVRVRAPS